MGLSAQARSAAEIIAAGDRDRLARLVRAGKVVRTGPANAFTRDIERRAYAVRPNKKRKGKKR